MRKFAIILDGTRLDLNGENGLYYVNPKGLGTENANQIASIHDNGFFLNTHSAVKSGTITGDLVIQSGYTGYKTFVDALMTAEKIVIAYKPNGTEYLCRVALNFVTKTEVGVRGAIVVPLSFVKLTPWYAGQSISASNAFAVTVGGQLETGIKLSTTSALVNPTIIMSDSDGTFAYVDLNLTTASGGRLEYSNDYDDCYIRYNGVDIISLADLSQPLFGRSKKQFTVRLTGANMTASIYRYWRTV